jgi:spore coat protein CotF
MIVTVKEMVEMTGNYIKTTTLKKFLCKNKMKKVLCSPAKYDLQKTMNEIEKADAVFYSIMTGSLINVSKYAKKIGVSRTPVVKRILESNLKPEFETYYDIRKLNNVMGITHAA